MGIVFDSIRNPASNIRLKIGHIEQHAEWVVVALDGYLDNQNTPAFLAEVNALLKPTVRVIGFDLAGLSYISSTGVGALSAITLDCRKKERYFFLSSVPERIDKVLQLLGFGSLFPIVGDPGATDFGAYVK